MTEYEIFRACFPQLRLDEELFAKVTDIENCLRFDTEGGFALIKDDKITLIAVHPDHQRNGTGSALMAICESEISDRCERAALGGPFCGAAEGSYEFFAKRGYTLGSVEYREMSIELRDYRDPLPDVNAEFAFYDNIADIRAAVESVDDEWVQYFDGNGEYFCAFEPAENAGRRLVSFCILDDDVDCILSAPELRTGSVGCVGTVPSARGRGYGLKMVSLALEELKRRGCGQGFIHWTHLEGWYGRLGAKTKIKFRTAEKEL